MFLYPTSHFCSLVEVSPLFWSPFSVINDIFNWFFIHIHIAYLPWISVYKQMGYHMGFRTNFYKFYNLSRPGFLVVHCPKGYEGSAWGARQVTTQVMHPLLHNFLRSDGGHVFDFFRVVHEPGFLMALIFTRYFQATPTCVSTATTAIWDISFSPTFTNTTYASCFSILTYLPDVHPHFLVQMVFQIETHIHEHNIYYKPHIYMGLYFISFYMFSLITQISYIVTPLKFCLINIFFLLFPVF